MLTLFGIAVVGVIALPVAFMLAVAVVAAAIPAFILASPFWVVAFITGNMTIGWVATGVFALLILFGGD